MGSASSRRPVRGPGVELGRRPTPLLSPSAGHPQEAGGWRTRGSPGSTNWTGNVPGVVFPCGLTHRPDTGELRLYYGAANTCIAIATAPLDDVLTPLLADSHTRARGERPAQNGP